jgi:hypothetical protein
MIEANIHLRLLPISPTANLLTVKLLINSTISTPNAKNMTMVIKDFYLNTPMAHYKYMLQL